MSDETKTEDTKTATLTWKEEQALESLRLHGMDMERIRFAEELARERASTIEDRADARQRLHNEVWERVMDTHAALIRQQNDLLAEVVAILKARP